MLERLLPQRHRWGLSLTAHYEGHRDRKEDELWWERWYLACRVSCYPQQGNNTPSPWQRSGQLGNLTHRATVRSLPWDLFCLRCINSFLSYRFPVVCRPALTACSLRRTIIRENYAMFTQQPKVSHHWFCFPPPCVTDGMFENQCEEQKAGPQGCSLGTK